jgi:hypothetical protein
VTHITRGEMEYAVLRLETLIEVDHSENLSLNWGDDIKMNFIGNACRSEVRLSVDRMQRLGFVHTVVNSLRVYCV